MNELKYVEKKGMGKTAVVMLHGYGANMHDLAPLADHLDPDNEFTWYFPDAPHPLIFDPSGVAKAWFPIDPTALEQAMQTGVFRKFNDLCPKELMESCELILSFLTKIENHYDNIILGGFSQGGMIAMNVLALAPSLFSSIVLLSTNPINWSFIEGRLQAADLKLPIFQSHGRHDPVLSFDYAKDLACNLETMDFNHDFHAFDGGHEIPMPILESLKKFLNQLK